MGAYKHLLVAVDLSEESRQVFARAAEEAKRHGATLSAVHVVRPVDQVYGGFGAMGWPGDYSGQLVAIERQVEDQARKTLAEMASSYDVASDRAHVCVGNPAVEVHRLAAERGVDLVVVGSHGRHGLGLLLGSTANAVLHGAQTDVLAVRVQLPK